MAQDIVSGLFGMSPFQVEQKQQQQINQNAAQFAQMPAVQRGVMGLYQGGAGLANAGAGLLGMENMEVQEARKREQALSGLDISSPESIMQRAQQIADPRLKMQLFMLAEKMRDDLSKRKMTEAHADYYKQGGRSAATGANSDVRLAEKLTIADRAARDQAISLGLSGPQVEEYVDAVKQKIISDWRALVPASSVPTTPVTQPITPQNQSAVVAPAQPAQAVTNAPTAVDTRMDYPTPTGGPNPAEQRKNLTSRLAIILDEKAKAKTPEEVATLEKEEAATRKELMKIGSPSAILPSKASALEAQERAKLKGREDIAIKGAGAEAERTGAKTGEMNVEAYQTVSSAQKSIAQIQDLKKQLESSQAITGMGAEMFKNIERVKALLGDKIAQGKVSDTEILDSMMGGDVFSMIGTLGIGARGMDTPAEREFMRQVLTGTIALNKETLIRMAEIREKIARRAIDTWNIKVESGELDNFFKARNLPKTTITIPSSSLTTKLTGQDNAALEWANANPNDPRAAKIKQKLGVK